MSSSALSDKLTELGLSNEGDKTTKQARLLEAAIQPAQQDEEEYNEMRTAPESPESRVDRLEGTLNEVLAKLHHTISLVANITGLKR